MDASHFIYGLQAILAIALVVALVTDVRWRRIPNWLNAAIVLGAPAYWWANGYALWPDVAIQLGIAAFVLGLFLIFFALGQMGGGDVNVHSKVVAPSPHGLAPAIRFFENASNTP